MKVLSFDAETDGLWGNTFAVAAIVYGGKPLKAIIFALLIACAAQLTAQTVPTPYNLPALCGDFSEMELSDRHGVDRRATVSKICLNSGRIEVTQGGVSWTEEIIVQSKTQAGVTAATEVGEYLIEYRENRITKVVFAPLMGATITYK